jgi:tetratricopeptide (TPR) repeat protein
MEFLDVKCPSCGGDLKVPEDRATFICGYCGTNILIRDVSKSGADPRNLLKLALTFLDQDNTKEAEEYFNRVLEIDADNPEAWLGKIKILDYKWKHDKEYKDYEFEHAICNIYESCSQRVKNHLLNTMQIYYTIIDKPCGNTIIIKCILQSNYKNDSYYWAAKEYLEYWYNTLCIDKENYEVDNNVDIESIDYNYNELMKYLGITNDSNVSIDKTKYNEIIEWAKPIVERKQEYILKKKEEEVKKHEFELKEEKRKRTLKLALAYTSSAIIAAVLILLLILFLKHY